MKVIAEKNNIELGAIILSHVLWMIPIAGGLYIAIYIFFYRALCRAITVRSSTHFSIC